MSELYLSVFERSPEMMNRLRALLSQFERAERTKVHLETIPFRGGWAKMVDVALRHFGPDVSEVGSTWINDFVRMNAIEPFAAQDIRLLGGEESFVPLSWQSGITLAGTTAPHTVWAIPWSVDVRPIFYRRDLFQKAGVKEKNAFATPKDLEQTLTKLQAAGVEVPLALPTLRSRISIHNMACFVWGAGGDFLSSDGKELRLTDPKTRAGMKAYFELGKFIPQPYHEAAEGVPEQLFYEGRAGVIMAGYWVLQALQHFPEVLKNTAVAQIPGDAFVGGLNLLVWKHTRRRREAVRLINFLTSTDISGDLFPDLGLPARLTSLEKPPFTTEPNFQALVRLIEKGRPLSSLQLWGLVENRLTDVIPIIWAEIFSTPNPDVDAVLEQFLEPLSRRLVGALSSLK